MLKKSLGKLTIALFILSGGLSFGQSTIVQTVTFSDVSDPVNYGLTFDPFNTSLGTLDYVDLTLSNVFVSGTASVTNESGASGKYTMSLQGDYPVSDLINGGGNSAESIVDTPTVKSGSVAPGHTFTIGTITNPVVNSTPGYATTDPFNSETSATDSLSYYESGDPATLLLYLNNANTVSLSGPNGNFSQSSVGSGTITLEYIYTPENTPISAPEPSALALWIIGLGCLFWKYRLGSKE